MMKINAEKYREALLYFIKNCNNKYLGSTKLNKLMYYLDFISFRDRQVSVTGDQYIHKDYGPVPDRVDNELFFLKKSSDLEIEISRYLDGFTTSFRVKREPEMSVFDQYEQDLLKNICAEFINWSTDKIVSQTHLEAPWFYSKPFEEVDYRYASDIEFFA